ncbi:GST C-terminal domain-containing protein [Fusarium keratoplasticum]|uniref:GST C-terminal domain-containing protein n=1 Tax=Fusarium keratoplasticum TaxID=1328300 RepID=A0ACC0QWS8_9HYPO|nr:GST C-terminal domain-containing protein [Fusarium keratoplasticum]KAI8669315.1 GST C-terminal domain-containing protein [Fusarium keratoplasticum]KAI8673918.1 GST C-terminal domain-containing protein [Fusarium keratoplasticum]
MANPRVIVYHYSYSPYARRLIWYLALRGIPYSQCIQPPLMPRPDVSRLGISYRRIPILAVGRDVYLDTRLQMRKLEAMFPELPRLGATSPDQVAVERLLSSFTNDTGILATALQLLPQDLPLLKDPAYYRDRGDFLGSELNGSGMDAKKPEALVEVARAIGFLETTLLADGRDWILGTEKPSLADIEAIWPFHWITGLPGALPEDSFSPSVYPRVYAWIRRFQAAVSAAKKRVGAPVTLSGEEAASEIRAGSFCEPEKDVEAGDAVVLAQGLRKGVAVMVWPTDTGSSGRDEGTLTGIDADEVVYETRGVEGLVRVHAPRYRFRVERVKDARL